MQAVPPPLPIGWAEPEPRPDGEPVPERAEDPMTLRVYRPVRLVEEATADGGRILVTWCEVKRLWSTEEIRSFHDGAERMDTYLFLDAQGRVYHHRPGVDFGEPSSYLRDGEPTSVQFHFTDRLPERARDLLGRPLSTTPTEGPVAPEVPGPEHE